MRLSVVGYEQARRGSHPAGVVGRGSLARELVDVVRALPISTLTTVVRGRSYKEAVLIDREALLNALRSLLREVEETHVHRRETEYVIKEDIVKRLMPLLEAGTDEAKALEHLSSALYTARRRLGSKA